MKLKEYCDKHVEASKLHAENIMKYGPSMPFGYPEAHPEQLKRIEFIAKNVTGFILDVGCDSGYILNESGGTVGVDISKVRLKAAKYWYPQLNLLQTTAEFLPFKSESFDTVICTELLEHVLDPLTVLGEIFRVLKPNGTLLVTVPDEVSGKSHMNPEHLRKFTEGSLRNILNDFFFIEEVYYVHGDYPTWCVLCRKET